MNRGAGRCATFLVRPDGVFFERMLGECSDRYAVEVHAYCLMDNHFHLLVHCPSGGLSPFMQHLSANYTRVFNERHSRDGPLFRGRFRSIVVHDEDYVLTAARYIHRNPTDLQPKVDLADYRWSSHGAFVGRRVPPPWLHTDHVLGVFGDDIAAYREMVESEEASAVPADHALDLIRLAADEQALGDAAGTTKIARTIATVLLDRLEPDASARLERSLTFTNRDARTDAIRRARARVESDPALAALVDRVERRAA